MEYELAGKGLHTMYLGEIVTLVSVVLALIAFAIPVMAIVVLVGILAGGVMVLIGLGKASSAHKGYNTAFVLALVGIVLSILKSFGDGGAITSAIDLIDNIVSCIQTYYICKASGELLESKGEYELAQKAEQIWKIVAVCEGVDIVCRLIGWIPVLNILAVLAMFAAAIASIVVYFMRIGFFNNASKALLDD